MELIGMMGAVVPCQTNTTTDGSATSATIFRYDRSLDGQEFATASKFGNQTDVFEYVSAPAIERDGVVGVCPTAPPSGFTRRTHTDYKFDYMGSDVHLRHLPTAVTVYNSGGSVAAKTTYGYDQTSVTPTGAGQHDATLTDHGNLTTESVYKDGSSALATVRTYDDLGNVLTATDPRGYATQYAYGSACSYALPTQVTNALNQHAHIQYDCNIGKPSSITGFNEEVTTLSYNDALDRLTSVSEPEGRQSSHAYSMNPPYVVSATAGVQTRVEFDGLGRKTAGILYGDGGAIVSRTDTQYDALGRVWKVSNPYDTGSPVWTTTAYDALGRVTRVTHPDNSYIENTYAGNQTTVRDESGKKRRNITDALGRLIEVREDPDGSNYGTTYTYDTIDNLTGVSQGGQPRSFAYDFLGRLLTATNPESGQISYTYDANGNVLTRTDARGVVTNYSPSGYGIDALNRVQKKTYSDATLAVTYTYDTVKLGRLSSVSNSVSTTNYTAYDGLGRVTAGNQNTGGTAYPFGYGYNALGLTSMTYPSGRSVSYTYDGAGRTLTAAGTLGSETHTYASEVIYEPHGGMHEWRRTYTPSGGSQYNIVEDHTYNSRLQPATVSLTANSTQRLALGFDYGTTGNNGNLLQQTITVPGASPASQIYSYDAVNRLSGASEGSAWSRTFGYDAYGNMWVSAASGIPAASFTPQSSAWFGANNRLVNQSLSIQYDGGGSLTQIGGYGFTYDAEGRLKTSTVNSIATEYFYDGEGRRVKKTTDGNTTVYAYDAFGKLAAQYGGTADGGGTQYLTTDHLGSTRLVTDTAGSPVKRYDFLPFGEEIPSGIGFRTAGLGYAADSFSLKFTGKERDAETGLDWFETRYLSGAQGRFTSPDSYNIVHEMLKGRDANEQQQILIGYISNPQVWNKYAYVLNNPLKYSDPDGRREESEEDKKRLALLQQYAQQSGDKALQAAANQATAEIKAAIAAVPEGQKKDPAGLAAALWSLGQLGNTAWGRQGSVDNGVTAPLGPETNKCTTFVATAYGEGAGVGFGGSGFPVGGRSATTFFWRRNVVSANTLASTTALPSLSIVSSPQLGGVVAFLNGGMGAGHSGIYIGGGAIAYAGKEAGKAQTIQYNVQHLQPAPAAIRYRIYKP